MITIRGGKQYPQGVSSLIAGGVLTALLAIALGPARGYAQGAPGPIPADPNLKVAFIGDSGNGSDFRRVLQLIKAEGAHMVLHQGDFDYADNARGFFATIDSILGDDFPYFASVGNHDAGSWRQDCSRRDGCYAKFLKTRMARIGVTPDDPDLDDQMYSVTYRGLKLVFVGERGARAGDNIYARYIQDQLATDHHVWKICSWHKNQRVMQVGGKADEMGWTSMQHQIVDASCSSPNNLCIAQGSPGKSFVFVSGLGGRDVKDQERCLPATFPYGCNGEWGKIYTRNQGAMSGALFIVFNINGDPSKAQGYFKNINGQVADTFDITVQASEAKRQARRP